MQVSIAAVEKIEGKVSAVDILGHKRELASGDALYLDELVNTTARGYVEVKLADGGALSIEPLQSLKLNSDLVDATIVDVSEYVLSHQLSDTIKAQLLSSFQEIIPSILTDIEPVHDLLVMDDDLNNAEAVSLALYDILQTDAGSQEIESFLRFDEIDASTVVYFSQEGRLTDLIDVKESADKIFKIDSIGYNNNDDLLSYLLENHLVD